MWGSENNIVDIVILSHPGIELRLFLAWWQTLSLTEPSHCPSKLGTAFVARGRVLQELRVAQFRHSPYGPRSQNVTECVGFLLTLSAFLCDLFYISMIPECSELSPHPVLGVRLTHT